MLIAGDTSNKEPRDMPTGELLRAVAALLIVGRGAIASTTGGLDAVASVAVELQTRAGLMDRAVAAYGDRPSALMLLREIKAVQP